MTVTPVPRRRRWWRPPSSGPDGKYLFDNLGPGNYTVVVDTADADLPAGYSATVTEYTETLAAGEDYLAADFPFVAVDLQGGERRRRWRAIPGETLEFGVNVDYHGQQPA